MSHYCIYCNCCREYPNENMGNMSKLIFFVSQKVKC